MIMYPRNPRDLSAFVVPECVTHHYCDDQGKWWWHCLTCNDGSNKRGRHHRGHKLESDAACGARQHARDKFAGRRWRAWYDDWNRRIMTIVDDQEWIAVWHEGFPDMALRTDLTL